jgi:hypothetical protein
MSIRLCNDLKIEPLREKGLPAGYPPRLLASLVYATMVFEDGEA